MEINVLGPLEFVREGESVSLGGLQQRAVLAVLVVHRHEAVSLDLLIEALWEGRPPQTAAKSVQVYVSQLRKALGPGVLETQGHAYLLRPGPDVVDIDRFEAALERGRELLATGDAEAASTVLRDALGLWRGSALAEFAYKGFAESEIARLDELRLVAVEEAIEADLRLGREAALVAELEALIRLHPLRERLRGQLMLALYRTGRQAEALENYRAAREGLVDELGLEPGPGLRSLEQAILNNDPELDGPKRVRDTGGPHGTRVRVAAVAALALVSVTVVWAVARGGNDAAAPRSVPVVANSVAIVDPASGRVVADVPVGNAPTSIVVGDGSAWVLNADDHTVSKISAPGGQLVKTFAVTGEPTDLAAGGGSVWVGSGAPVQSAESFATLDPDLLTRIDPLTGTVVDHIRLPDTPGGVPSNRATGQRQIVVSEDFLFAVDAEGTLWRGEGDEATAVKPGRPAARALALADQGLWVVGDEGVSLLDPASGDVEVDVPITTSALVGVTTGDGAVWVTDPIAGSLWRVDPGPRAVTRATPIGAGGWSVAYGAGAVWVVNVLDGTLVKVDPDSLQVLARIRLHGTPNEVAFSDGRIWVTIGQGSPGPGLSALAADEVSGSVSSASCGPVSYGGEGTPDFVIASDLPLQTGQRNVSYPMTQAIAFLLARQQFRAGDYTVGYQSCDDSTVQAGGWDPAKCVGNAKAYAESERVIGVIGPYHSGCAGLELPVLNQAGVPLISPANSAPGLTESVPGSPTGEPEAFYPTGQRTYARVSTRDDTQAAAAAMLVRQLGLKSAFIVRDGREDDPYIPVVASAFERATRQLGLDVVGTATWDPDSRGLDRLVAKVRAARPDAVFLAGIVFDGAGPLVKGLRAALGPDAPLIAPDGFSVIPYLRSVAGPAASGMYVSLLGMPNGSLGDAGEQFLEDFAATQPGGAVPSFGAAYAAQAAQVLLDAIARSDGTRASVAEELFATDVQNGILGTFRIDSAGDSTSQAVTILRVSAPGRASPTLLEDHAGSIIDRVIVPPASLVR